MQLSNWIKYVKHRISSINCYWIKNPLKVLMSNKFTPIGTEHFSVISVKGRYFPTAGGNYRGDPNEMYPSLFKFTATMSLFLCFSFKIEMPIIKSGNMSPKSPTQFAKCQNAHIKICSLFIICVPFIALILFLHIFCFVMHI